MKLAVYVRSFARPIGRVVTADYLRSTFSPGRRLPVQAPGDAGDRIRTYDLRVMSATGSALAMRKAQLLLRIR